MPSKRVPDGDRRARQAGRLASVLKILELIQSRGRYGVKELSAELEVSERTVYRYLSVLQLAGVPYFHDQDTKSIQVRPGFRFPTLNLTDEEVIGQATAEVLTSAQGLDVTQGAGPTSRKLKVGTNEENTKLLAEVERVTSVLDLKLADHSRHHELIKTIQWALVKGHKLTGTYSSPYEPKPKRLDLHPYRLCLIKQAWYLVATANGSITPQTYRVTRFKTLRPMDAHSVVPDDFDLRNYFGNAWGVYRGDQTHEIELLFARDAADLVTETTWHSTQKAVRHQDGSVTLSFVVDGLNEISYWLLGWSGRVTVIRPDTLRLTVLDHLRKAMDLNNPSPRCRTTTRITVPEK